MKRIAMIAAPIAVALAAAVVAAAMYAAGIVRDEDAAISAAVASINQPSVSFEYDRFSDDTSATLSIPMRSAVGREFVPTLSVIVVVPGDAAPPIEMPRRFSAWLDQTQMRSNSDLLLIATMGDGTTERIEIPCVGGMVFDFDGVQIGTVATASAVEFKHGLDSGAVPHESLAAIREYLAMFE